MPSFADIYASCLYASGEGLPLWNPSPLRLGDVGYVRDGSFIVLYNAVDGPEALSDAASIHLARRSDRSVSRDRVRRDSGARPKMDIDDPIDATPAVAGSSRRSSLATSSVSSSSAAFPMSRSAASDSLLPSATKKGSPTLSHRKLRSGTPPEGPYPPMPLSVDQEAPQLFDMGPRMSSNYRCLGLDAGVSVPGAPVTVKIGFESSGGDGAILIPRDPTERTRLKYLGVLKAYIKAHHKWIYETYGRIEAISVDDLALIYGQDRTSDWAVAVSRDAARGARAEFEIFGAASAGFWGNWSHTLSACQRGPHRPQVARRDRATGTSSNDSSQGTAHNVDHVQAPLGRKRQDDIRTWGMNVEGGVVNASFSFGTPPSKTRRDEEHERGRRRNPPSRAHSISWSPGVHAPPDQTISIRRVTASTSLGLGFLPARPKAAAEPRDPDVERKRDNECAPVARQDSQDSSVESHDHKQWCDDPLEALHEWIHESGGAKVQVSIASDDDCLQLLSLLGHGHVFAIGLQAAVRIAADRFARISVDEGGFATVSMGHASSATPSLAPFLPKVVARPPSSQSPRVGRADHRWTSSTFVDKENRVEDMFAAARRAVSVSISAASSKTPQPKGVAKPRVMLSASSRFNTMLPCRPMHNVGASASSLVLP
ncbi:probable conserved hypothetical Ustilaginaceae-specific protein [Ustilago trichophora]|uniref:Probable conserved hypothetical Ustilaginaceae-specific protein n=1 Tax=Ustilago trichophora TaxID=86804 RepID=A0A5C3E2K4_9BASI|nr:probable conserved hypothetical Ustilaginaceae-specific protein [Ustilago trichophora]